MGIFSEQQGRVNWNHLLWQPLNSDKELAVPQQFDYISEQLTRILDDMKALTRSHYDEIRARHEDREGILVRLTRIEGQVKQISDDEIEGGHDKKKADQKVIEMDERIKVLESLVSWGKWLAGAVGAAVAYTLSQAISQIIEWLKK